MYGIDNLSMMAKPKLKDLYIQNLNEIESLLEWLRERNISGLDKLILNSNYLQNHSCKDPDNFIHQIMGKKNYEIEIKGLQTLLHSLQKTKQKYEVNNDLSRKVHFSISINTHSVYGNNSISMSLQSPYKEMVYTFKELGINEKLEGEELEKVLKESYDEWARKQISGGFKVI